MCLAKAVRLRDGEQPPLRLCQPLPHGERPHRFDGLPGEETGIRGHISFVDLIRNLIVIQAA